MQVGTSCSVISLTVEKDRITVQRFELCTLCEGATISLCLNYNSTIVGRLRVWWGEGDVSSSAVTFVLGGETMQTDEPTLSELEQDVHLILKDSSEFQNWQRGYWVLGLRQFPRGTKALSPLLFDICTNKQIKNVLLLSSLLRLWCPHASQIN